MQTLATYPELVRHLGSSDLDTGRAVQALEGASSAIRNVCGWTITQETVTEVHFWTPVVLLPTLRLTAVSVTVGPVSMTDGRDFDWLPSGVVRLVPARVGYRMPITISYTHGYTQIPSDVRQVCCEWAAEAFSDLQGAVSVTDTTGPFSRTVRYSENGARQSPRLAPYTLPVAG